jgi:ABC-type Mn2+/Zn2+ transport system permease subunit
MAVACATLSVFVVARRWAFIGEGISHSGFGGAGTAWLLALAFPAFARPAAVYGGVVVFCLATALLIGSLTRGRRVESDTAIGIFLVASLAWGFLAQQVYTHVRPGRAPFGFNTLLFGNMGDVSLHFAVAAAFLCAAVVATVLLLGKEIVYYCFDPAMAEASGVRTGFIHYLLMLLVAATIIVGSRIVGTVLVTALLVLPGATAGLLTARLRASVVAAVVIAVIGATTGLALNHRWPFVPTGPAMVLALFALFLAALALDKLRPRRA